MVEVDDKELMEATEIVSLEKKKKYKEHASLLRLLKEFNSLGLHDYLFILLFLGLRSKDLGLIFVK